jgi:hypothetical protein
MQTIIGNTYPVKEKLKALGAHWNSAAQGWDIGDDQADAARALVAAAGPSTYTPRRAARYSGARSSYTRFASGAEVFTNKRGRCEDAPCCGCCS